MAIIINGKNLSKRIINGKEVERVTMSGAEIRPNRIYLPLKDDFADHGVNNVETSPSNVTLTTLNGVKCAKFDPSLDSYIGINSIGNRCLGSPDFTISVWAYMLGNGHDSDTLVFFGNIGENYAAGLWIDDPFNLCIGGWWNDQDTGFVLQTNQWYHMVLTHENGTAKVYVGGSLIYTGSVNYNITSSYAIIGRGLGDRGWIDGYINEVIIENKVWTASQVSTYYNSTVGGH